MMGGVSMTMLMLDRAMDCRYNDLDMDTLPCKCTACPVVRHAWGQSVRKTAKLVVVVKWCSLLNIIAPACLLGNMCVMARDSTRQHVKDSPTLHMRTCMHGLHGLMHGKSRLPSCCDKNDTCLKPMPFFKKSSR